MSSQDFQDSYLKTHTRLETQTSLKMQCAKSISLSLSLSPVDRPSAANDHTSAAEDFLRVRSMRNSLSHSTDENPPA
jgi:hypothetical protein